MNADDNEIFKITGCLSKCEKYKYSAWAVNDLQNYPAEDPEYVNTLWLRFFVPSGEYELREQVLSPHCPLVKYAQYLNKIDLST